MNIKPAVNYSGTIFVPHLIISVLHSDFCVAAGSPAAGLAARCEPSASSAVGTGIAWQMAAGTIYSFGQAARGERRWNSLSGLFSAIRGPRRQFRGVGGSQNLHSSEATLAIRKSRLVSISAFSKQWKLFFPLDFCPVSTSRPANLPNTAFFAAL